MVRHLFASMCLSAALCTQAVAADPVPVAEPIAAYTHFAGTLQPEAILSVTKAVADWQLAHLQPNTYPWLGVWEQGACWTGYAAILDLPGCAAYEDRLRTIADACSWKLGKRTTHADDHCVAQLYLELLKRKPDAGKLTTLQAQFDEALKQSKLTTWSWCDALFMAPPALARLSAMTGDAKYLTFMDQAWADTRTKLFDTEEHLFARDKTYLPKREQNGQKIFWSRGNGWVMGGLVRVLQVLPADHPTRAGYESLFKEMAARIVTLQQPDGLWHASLLAQEYYPIKEVSGTGFFTYAFAWGINQHLLDRAAYLPAVTKGWAGLVGCVNADGKLGFVQPVGASPAAVKPEQTQTYGVGAFLLAASEVYQLAKSPGPAAK